MDVDYVLCPQADSEHWLHPMDVDYVLCAQADSDPLTFTFCAGGLRELDCLESSESRFITFVEGFVPDLG
ncbi:hypothetical protein ACLOJK_018162 [Asimina triloba]